MARESLSTKREIPMKENGPTIVSMAKAPILKSYLLMIKRNSISTLESLRRGLTMGRELWSTRMAISTMGSGPLVRKRDQACTNGRMEITTMEIGERTLRRAQELHALGVSFMTESSISASSTDLERKRTKMVTP